MQFFWPPIFVVFLSFIGLRKSRPMNDKKTGHFEKVRTLECRASVLLDLPWVESGPVGVRSVLLPVGFYSKGPPWLRLLMARVRLPQTSLMRSGSWSVPQPTPATSFPKVAAAESHPDPMWSTQRFGSNESMPYGSDRICPVRYWLTHRSNIVRSTKDCSLYRIVLKVATFRPNQRI